MQSLEAAGGISNHDCRGQIIIIIIIIITGKYWSHGTITSKSSRTISNWRHLSEGDISRTNDLYRDECRRRNQEEWSP